MNNRQCWQLWEGVLPANTCDTYIQLCKASCTLQDGTTFNAAKSIRKTKIGFYRTKQKELQQIREQKAKEEAAAAAAAAARSRAESRRQYDPRVHGPNNYGLDRSGKQSFDSGQGFGIGSDGGPVSNKTGRGRTGFMMGGLTDLVDIYD